MHIFTVIKVNFITLILGMAFALVIGYAIGYFLRKMFTEYQIKDAEERRKKIIQDAEKEVESRLKSGEIEAREKSLVLKAELEKEMKGERDRLRNLEGDLERKEREIRAENQKFQTRDSAMRKKGCWLLTMLTWKGNCRPSRSVSLRLAFALATCSIMRWVVNDVGTCD